MPIPSLHHSRYLISRRLLLYMPLLSHFCIIFFSRDICTINVNVSMYNMLGSCFGNHKFICISDVDVDMDQGVPRPAGRSITHGALRSQAILSSRHGGPNGVDLLNSGLHISLVDILLNLYIQPRHSRIPAIAGKV